MKKLSTIIVFILVTNAVYAVRAKQANYQPIAKQRENEPLTGEISVPYLGRSRSPGDIVFKTHAFGGMKEGGGPQGTEGLSGMPDCFSLSAYPCPASNALVMEYAVPIPGVVHVTLYDAAGRCVREIGNAYMQPGMYHKQVDLAGIAQGVYFLRLESDNEVITRETIVLR